MKHNGVIQRKLELIAGNTRQLRGLLPVSTDRLQADFFLKSGVERTLQVSMSTATRASILPTLRRFLLRTLAISTTLFMKSKPMADAVNVDFAALEAFFAQDGNVVFATVFGSSKDGKVAPGSDLDVAVLFRDPPRYGNDYLDYYLRLCAAVPTVEAVDLVNLNTAEPILAFEALRGRMVCKNDAGHTAGFFSLVCREYEDVMGNLAHQRWLRTQAA